MSSLRNIARKWLQPVPLLAVIGYPSSNVCTTGTHYSLLFIDASGNVDCSHGPLWQDPLLSVDGEIEATGQVGSGVGGAGPGIYEADTGDCSAEPLSNSAQIKLCADDTAGAVLSALGSTYGRMLTVADGLSSLATSTSADLIGILSDGLPNGKQMWSSGSTSLSTSATEYAPLSGVSAPDSTEANRVDVENEAGTYALLCCHLTVAPGGGATRTTTFRKGGSSQALTVTFGAADVDQCDSTHTATSAQSDLLGYRLTLTGSPAAALEQCTVKYRYP